MAQPKQISVHLFDLFKKCFLLLAQKKFEPGSGAEIQAISRLFGLVKKTGKSSHCLNISKHLGCRQLNQTHDLIPTKIRKQELLGTWVRSVI